MDDQSEEHRRELKAWARKVRERLFKLYPEEGHDLDAEDRPAPEAVPSREAAGHDDGADVDDYVAGFADVEGFEDAEDFAGEIPIAAVEEEPEDIEGDYLAGILGLTGDAKAG